MVTSKQRIRPFLKWPGGKYRIMDTLLNYLPPGNKLVEPFAGSCAVFLNTEYEYYKLNDINPDIINLYKILQIEGQQFIEHSKQYFNKRNNSKNNFYKLREKFNNSNNTLERASLFIYLNRHCYNGLVRYNKSKGEFNSPFGQYKNPYFPADEMLLFYNKAKRAEFTQLHFRDSLKHLKKGNIVYCDPPYIPLSNTANFTQYSKHGFYNEEQEELVKLAKKLCKRNIKIVISNHANQRARKLYQGSKIVEFSVPRFISCKTRKPVKELLAMW